MTTYTKPHLSYEQQVELLESRGLIVSDKEYAKLKLMHIGYYRLSAYFLPFYVDKDKFIEGTTFEEVIEVYHFDKELRVLTFNAIEKIEIFLRTAISYNFSKKYGAFGYSNKDNFCIKKDKDFDMLIKSLSKESSRSKETFVKHFKSKYKQEELPIWMVVETVSFGTMSRLYSLLCPDIEKDILEGIGLSSLVFVNWLHVISYVRNITAHHSRLWNRQFVIKTKIPKNKKSLKNLKNDKYITIAVMINYILQSINDTFEYQNELLKLFKRYEGINFEEMGFSEGWEKLDIWKTKYE